jgi:predicted RNA-binding Zn ribbon-like protein
MARAQTLDSFGWPGRDWRLMLADTIVVVKDREVDVLCEEVQLGRWLEAEQRRLGTVSPEEAPALSDIHALREAIRALFAAAAAGEDLPEHAASVVNRYSAGSAWYRQIDLSEPRTPRVTYGGVSNDRAAQVLAAVADAAIDLLTGPDRVRIRVCSAPSCGMYFVAGKHSQQWCSKACGNRARVARHYRRSRPTDA